MFDLELDDVDQAIVETARRLASGPVDGAAFAADRDQSIDDVCVRAVHEFGFTCPTDENVGGAGLPSAFQQVLALSELAYGDPGVIGVLTLSSAAALVIGSCGTAEQQQRWLAQVAERARTVVPLALYESFGRAPEDFATTIVAEGEGRWRVRGRKVGVALAEPNPGHVLVVGRNPGSGELRAAFVPTGDAGVSLACDVDPAADQGFIALSQARFATVDVDVMVDGRDVLGAGEDIAGALAVAVARTRLLPAAISLGGGHRAREYATRYATEREAFGSPIFAFQGVSFPLADDQIGLDAARLGLWRVASALDAGDEKAPLAVSAVVNECHAAANTATRDAIQTLGGHGFLADHPVERWYRCAAMLSSLDNDPLFTRFAIAV